MHEGHFTQQIVKTIIDELSQYPERVVESVTVKVGESYHLLEDAVLLHYELISKGTRLEGVKLNLLEEPMQVVCDQCGQQGPVEDHHMLLCSYCHSKLVAAVSGDTITVEEIVLKP